MLLHLTTPIDDQCNDWGTPLTSSARSFAFDASLTNVSPHTVSPCMNTRVASDNASEPEERFFKVASFRPRRVDTIGNVSALEAWKPISPDSSGSPAEGMPGFQH